MSERKPWELSKDERVAIFERANGNPSVLIGLSATEAVKKLVRYLFEVCTEHSELTGRNVLRWLCPECWRDIDVWAKGGD